MAETTTADIGYRSAAARPSRVKDKLLDGVAVADEFEREWDGDTLQDAVIASERKRRAARQGDEDAFEAAYREGADK